MAAKLTYPACTRDDESACRFKMGHGSSSVHFEQPIYSRDGSCVSPALSWKTNTAGCLTCGGVWFGYDVGDGWVWVSVPVRPKPDDSAIVWDTDETTV